MELLSQAHSLLQQFAKVTISHVLWANELAKQASGFRLELNEINNVDVAEVQPKENRDWRVELKQY